MWTWIFSLVFMFGDLIKKKTYIDFFIYFSRLNIANEAKNKLIDARPRTVSTLLL